MAKGIGMDQEEGELHPARGSDDNYCSVYPAEGHSWTSIGVDAPPIKWILRCILCNHINSADLRDQLKNP